MVLGTLLVQLGRTIIVVPMDHTSPDKVGGGIKFVACVLVGYLISRGQIICVSTSVLNCEPWCCVYM